MNKISRVPKVRLLAGTAFFLGACGFLGAQGLDDLTPQLPVSDPACTHFLQNKPQTSGNMFGASAAPGTASRLSKLTALVANALPPVPGGTRTGGASNAGRLGLIDKFIFSALEDAGVQPADTTTDWEYIRRVTLDLTGRIPDPGTVLQFVNDTSSGKRAALVEQLLAKPEWTDKWTMFLGDLLKNNSSNTQINRYRPGVQAFYNYIKSSVAANKPYDQMTRELIAAEGDNSYSTGEINFNVGGVVTGGPTQDVYDQQTANIADTFLGVAHVNCLLCHNGAGHLTGLSLWGGQQTRVGGWGMAAFLSHTYTFSTAVSADATTPRYWTVTDSSPKANGYALNTTTGNRPPRQPIGSLKTITPSYIFTGETPKAGENTARGTGSHDHGRSAVRPRYRELLLGLLLRRGAGGSSRSVRPPSARSRQSAALRAGLCKPSNPRLLNALAQAFIDNKFDLKWLMRQMVNSSAYQLSSRYDGQWNEPGAAFTPANWCAGCGPKRFTTPSRFRANIVPAYNITTYGTMSYAMQFPEPSGCRMAPMATSRDSWTLSSGETATTSRDRTTAPSCRRSI